MLSSGLGLAPKVNVVALCRTVAWEGIATCNTCRQVLAHVPHRLSNGHHRLYWLVSRQNRRLWLALFQATEYTRMNSPSSNVTHNNLAVTMFASIASRQFLTLGKLPIDAWMSVLVPAKRSLRKKESGKEKLITSRNVAVNAVFIRNEWPNSRFNRFTVLLILASGMNYLLRELFRAQSLGAHYA